MLVPLYWLREYCDPPLSTEEIAARLTLTGTKDERVFHHGVRSGESFVVGRVLEVAPHPDADRLRVCTVDIGGQKPATIVCGAPNVAADQLVGVARPGAVMPDGTKLKEAKLRGVVSQGMIVSETEVQVGVDTAGIMVLDSSSVPGSPLGDALPLEGDVIEFEITPNRPDCLGVYGIARELHASTGAPLAVPPWEGDPGTPDGAAGGVRISVEVPELCPRFTARTFRDVRIGPSPLWLKAHLVAAGMRPISNVVDITNYVMLLTGQPLHAFDLDRVAGGELTVRRAGDGEQVETLDGAVRTLDSEMVLICDAEGPTSIAGIMGGARSEVGEDTTSVLLEVANWVGANIHRTSQRLGLRSEASGRFEKGLSPESALEAQAVATRLMIELCGARVEDGTIDICAEGVPAAPEHVHLRPARVRELLGSEIDASRCVEILESLGFGIERVYEELEVVVPHFRRGDVYREVDLIEEVARIDGLDRLPATLPRRNQAAGRLTHAQRVRRRAEDALAARGLDEIVGWSFADPGLLDRLRLPDGHAMREVIRLENPLSEDQSMMRPTVLGSLLDVASHNRARGAGDIAIFESGTVYRRAHDARPADEHHALAALLHGSLSPRTWRGEEGAQADFFTAKGVLAGLLGALGVRWSLAEGSWPFLHPGRSAAVVVGDEVAGFLGEVHPLVSATWDLERTAAFAVDLGRIAAAAAETVIYTDVTSFPPVREDLAVVLAEEVAAARVLEVVAAAGGDTLTGADVFDVYSGPQVGEGRRSLALHLEFRAPDRTLTDEEVAERRAAIAQALASELGGELRA
jgi:phenylalanyl-tRNA synthetase beta chain